MYKNTNTLNVQQKNKPKTPLWRDIGLHSSGKNVWKFYEHKAWKWNFNNNDNEAVKALTV